MAKTSSRQVNTDKNQNLSERVASLEQRIQECDALLARDTSNEAIHDFDEGTELLLSEVFGNPSEILEAYAYAQLGEAGSWINLPEEGQLEGEQDMERQSLHQRQGVLKQALAELNAEHNQKAH